jgi:radical SAM superfamily enzyme YgiQ (UPF0313 family)
MEKDGLIGALSFHGFITSNLASRDLLEAAKYMGFRSIRFGAETGSERLLKSMKGSWASVHSHQKCIDLCAELGLEVSAAFMLGTPGETETDLESTYAFLKRNQGVLKINGLYLTTPIPGTPYWDMAMQKGLVDEDMDWDRLNFDFRKIQSFDPKAAPYMNNESMPIEKVLEYAHRFQTEFAMVTYAHAVYSTPFSGLRSGENILLCPAHGEYNPPRSPDPEAAGNRHPHQPCQGGQVQKLF